MPYVLFCKHSSVYQAALIAVYQPALTARQDAVAGAMVGAAPPEARIQMRTAAC